MTAIAGPSKRKGGKKVKTGCMTCRARRVKCGEERPGCLRCKKLGQECDGYEPGRRPLTLEKHWNITSMQSVFPTFPTTILQEPYLGSIFDVQERRYFKLYEDHASEVNGPFTSDFWTRLVLQASHQDESVRYAVVALGALQKGRECSPPSTPGSDIDNFQCGNATQQFAFNTYQKAIVCLLESLERGDISPKIALITCVLFVCMEILSGDLNGALAQVLSGVKLLQQYKGNSIDELSDLEFVSGSGLSIEDQLTQIFAELDNQARTLMRVKQQPFDASCPMLVEEENLPNLIPLHFSTLEEARYSFTLLQTRSNRLHELGGFSRFKLLSDFQVQQIEAQTTLLNSWAAAFAPILYRSQSDPRYAREMLGALTLQAHWTFAVIMINSTFDSEEVFWDQHLEDFRGIVTNLRPVVQNQGKRPKSSVNCPTEGFTFEETTITPLYLTATKCRDPIVRREAVALLQQSPRREGIFDSLMAAKISEYVIELEEEGSDMFGFVPEESRVRVSNVEPDLVQRRASITTGQRIFGIDTEFNVRKRKVEW